MDSPTYRTNEDQCGCSHLKVICTSIRCCSGEGYFLGASAVSIRGISDPEIAEAIACTEGLALASDLMLQNFRLASDCENVIRSLKGVGMRVYGHVVQEIKARAGSFGRVEFVHECRGPNVDAHCLARDAVRLAQGRHVWFLDPLTQFVTRTVSLIKRGGCAKKKAGPDHITTSMVNSG